MDKQDDNIIRDPKLTKEIRKRHGIDGIERRYITLDAEEMRFNESDNVIEGYGARFDVWSENLGFFKEKIAPGAFGKTIGENDIRSLFNHDNNKILGRTKAKTLELWEDQKGLMFKTSLPDTTYARDLAISIKRKDITQNSFGFETVRDTWNKSNDKRILEEVRLFDVGPVTFPAYPQTTVKLRDSLIDIGIDFDSLLCVFAKHRREIELTNTDVDLLKSTIEIFNRYLPVDEPLTEDHSNEPVTKEHSEEITEPNVLQFTLLRKRMSDMKTKKLIGV